MGGNAVHVLGSMTIFLHVNNETFKALCQVTNPDDCFLMGRALARTMGYIDYPDIKPPTKVKQNTQTNITAMQAETNTIDIESTSEPPQQNQSKQTSAKSMPKSCNIIDRETLQLIQEIINAISSSMNLMRMQQQNHRKCMQAFTMNIKVTVNGKEHSLPTTKEYILKGMQMYSQALEPYQDQHTTSS